MPLKGDRRSKKIQMDDSKYFPATLNPKMIRTFSRLATTRPSPKRFSTFCLGQFKTYI
jgi:hypothetical protein